MPQVVTQLVIDSRGAQIGSQEFVASMEKAKSAAIAGGEATATSFERAQNRWQQSLAKTDPVVKAQIAMQRDLARQQAVNDNAVRLGIATQDAANIQLEKVRQQHQSYIATLGKSEEQHSRLSTQAMALQHSMRSSIEQLAMGVPVTQVLTQQMNHLSYAATGEGGLTGAFKEVGSLIGGAVSWAGRFAVSAAGITTATVAMGAAALYAASSYSSAQREIDKVLSGAGGAASGATRGGINQIAEGASSAFGLSVSEARKAATEFAATGRIYGDNIRNATLITKDFALALGIDVADASKKLAKDLQDPVAAALEWSKTIKGIDAGTVNYIQALVSMGDKQGAINALITAAAPGTGDLSKNVDILTRAWNAASNAVSNYIDVNSKRLSRTVERVTGIEGGGFTDQERLTGARRTQQSLQGISTAGMDPGTAKAFADAVSQADAEVAKLQRRLEDRSYAQRFAQLSLDTRAFGESIDGTTPKINQLQEGLANIAKYQAMRLNQGQDIDPTLDRQAQIGSVLLAQTLQQQEAEQRKGQVLAENALKYKDTSIAIANQRELSDAQLAVAQAATGQARAEAEQHLAIVQAKQQGLSLTDQIKTAEDQRAIAVAQINTSLDQQLKSLQDQAEVLRGATELDRARIKAAQDYKKAVEDGGDSLKAGAVAAQAIANARTAEDAREQAQADADAASAAQRKAQANQQAAAAALQEAQAAARAAAEYERAYAALKDLPFRLLDVFAAINGGSIYDGLFKTKNGSYSQFNPSGYTSTVAGPASFAKSIGGLGGADIDQATGLPTSAGLAKLVNNILGKGGSTTDAINALLGQSTGGLGQTGGLTSDTLSMIQQLTNLLPKDQQADVINRELAQLKAQPQNIDTLNAIKQLTDSLDQLKQATDANTSAITDVLSPFYSQDPRNMRLGFRAFAGGGIMTPWGELPIHNYAGGGITRGPQVSIFGEGSTPEAYVPVPSGRIPVEVRGSNDNQPRTIIHAPITVSMTANVSRDEARRTGFQIAQSMKRTLAS